MTREDAIGVLEDVRDAICDNIPGNHAELDELREAVRTATEALRARKTGIWRRAEYGYTCNQCGKTHLLRTAYCPTCGAEMDF